MKSENMFKSSQKGASIYLSVLILAIVLSMVLGLTTILIGQMKMIRGMGNSVVAFYAADTGVEKVLKIIIHDDAIPAARYPTEETETLGNNSEYFVEVVCCDSSVEDCDFNGADVCPPGLEEKETCKASRYCIRSVGEFNNTKRAIEAKIYPIED